MSQFSVRVAGVLVILLATSVAWAEMPTGNNSQSAVANTASHPSESTKAKPKPKPTSFKKKPKPARPRASPKPSTKPHASKGDAATTNATPVK